MHYSSTKMDVSQAQALEGLRLAMNDPKLINFLYSQKITLEHDVNTKKVELQKANKARNDLQQQLDQKQHMLDLALRRNREQESEIHHLRLEAKQQHRTASSSSTSLHSSSSSSILHNSNSPHRMPIFTPPSDEIELFIDHEKESDHENNNDAVGHRSKIPRLDAHDSNYNSANTSGTSGASNASAKQLFQSQSSFFKPSQPRSAFSNASKSMLFK